MFDWQIFFTVFYGVLLGHCIGEFIRAAYRRWKDNRDTRLIGVHYYWK